MIDSARMAPPGGEVPSADGPDEDRERQIFFEQVQLLFESSRETALASTLNACFLAFFQRDVIAPSLVYGWLTYMLLVVVGRFWLVRWYWQSPRHERQRAIHRWDLFNITGVALSALGWGGAGVLLFPESSPIHQAFLAFVVGVWRLPPRRSSRRAPPAWCCTCRSFWSRLPRGFFSGDALHQAMGGIVALYLLVLLGTGYRTHRTIRLSLELRHDNEGLIRNLREEIAQRGQAETALRGSESRYRHLVNSAVDVIFTVHQDTVLTSLSPSFTTTLGWEVEEWIGRVFPPIVHADDLPAAMRYFERGLAGTPHQTFELRILSKSGAYVPMEFVVTPQRIDDSIVGVFGFSRDITARRQAEAALQQSQEQLVQSQKMEAVGKLAGGIAHEFNNILQVIKGYCYFLLPGLAQQEALRRDVEGIEQSADRAALLTSQLLAFSRRQVILPRVLDLNAVILEQHRMLERLIGETVKLDVDLATDVPQVKADPAQIGQVLLNLVNNARDAMPHGGVLTLATAAVTRPAAAPGVVPPGSYARLTVRDTGCGMPPEIVARIFEPFFTTKEVGKGTGLGLSTVYGLIAQIGGYIQVASQPGQGTTFTILLPAAKAAGADEGPETPTAGPVTGTETSLLAEDEPAVRAVLQQALRAKGYRVLVAGDGRAALQVCRNHEGPVHLAVVDLVMPELGGRELVQQLLPRYPHLKVLYMSGYTDEPLDLQELPDSIKAFLQKPFASDLLLRTVRTLLDGA
ncbi:MAG: ATP-binding protein [Nitrospiraceae bacterium]